MQAKIRSILILAAVVGGATGISGAVTLTDAGSPVAVIVHNGHTNRAPNVPPVLVAWQGGAKNSIPPAVDVLAGAGGEGSVSARVFRVFRGKKSY